MSHGQGHFKDRILESGLRGHFPCVVFRAVKITPIYNKASDLGRGKDGGAGKPPNFLHPDRVRM